MIRRVLVVDDEATVRKLLCDIFKDAGYEVRGAASCPEALELLKVESFPVMFFDIMLPGMTGLELAALVRKRNPISILHAVTGLPSMFEVASCRAAGFDDYFTKPFDPADILHAAAEAFRKIERWHLGGKGD